MIKTNYFASKRKVEDGTRIVVTAEVKDWVDFDEHIPNLAPPKDILWAYKNDRINWNEYEKRFLIFHNNQKSKRIVRWLKRRSNKGEIITLLCWEKEDRYCHRRLIKQLIENEK